MPILRGDRLTHEQAKAVDDWLVANGCRDHLPLDSTVVVHGNKVTYEAMCRRGKEHLDTARPAPNLGLCIRGDQVVTTTRTMRVRTRMSWLGASA